MMILAVFCYKSVGGMAIMVASDEGKRVIVGAVQREFVFFNRVNGKCQIIAA